MKRNLIMMILLVFLLAACQTAEVAPAETEVPQTDVEAMPAADTHDEEMPAEEAAAPADGALTYTLAAGETTLSYSVGETFINQNNKFATAVGVTGSVAGTITLDTANLQSAALSTITAEVVEFTSDSSRRDNTIRDRFLESTKFPTVTFAPTAITGLPENYAPGDEITFQVMGDTTIRETTLPLAFNVSAKLENGALSGQATTTFLMSDFGFGPISIGGILETEDEVSMTLDYVAYP
ncbi:MAG: YceI family protein [Chloroflexi bacterium]|jgi:polyisoprenoid-binding protein YceI|nr:YceI family protein [Chloroflexota bacterium]